MHDRIKTQNKKDFLRKIESAIARILVMFEADLKGYVGDFSNDEIVQYQINSADDYESFQDLFNRRKNFPLVAFFSSRDDDVKKILSFDSTTITVKKIREPIQRIQSILADISKVDDNNKNKKLGYTVIICDQPKSYKLLTLDHVFDILGPILNKKVEKIQKN